MKALLFLLPLSASAQCILPVDTMFTGECNYVLEVPPIQPGETVTRCYHLISESDNFNPGYVFVQTPACGPLAYLSLSYEVFSEDCSTSMGSGTIFPVSSNPTLYLPDTSVNYVACFTYTAVCELTATCPTYQFSPLPVELLYFKGEQVGSGIMLKWATASEVASSHFIIRRSTDLVEWRSVWVLGASGFSSTVTEYSAMDRNPLQGLAYYRLEEIGMDGAVGVHHSIAVNFNGGSPAYDFLLFYNLNGQIK